jgi:hypothetical protein
LVLAADRVIADERGRVVGLLRIVANPNPTRVRFAEEAMTLMSASRP